jgi:hypothetical protein
MVMLYTFTPLSQALPIVKMPGDSFGADLSFTYQGPAVTVWAGIGLAFAEAIGHNPCLYFAMKQVSLPACASPTNQSVTVTGTIPTTAQVPSTYDAQKFISKTQPVSGQQPPNDFGVNNWDDDVYTLPGQQFGAITAVYR